MGQKTGVCVYTEKPFVRITHIHTDHRVIKKTGWALTWRWALTRENTVVMNLALPFFSCILYVQYRTIKSNQNMLFSCGAHVTIMMTR